MPFRKVLESRVQNIIKRNWTRRQAHKVPSNETIALAGGSVELDATFLYADLANSSKIAKTLDRRVAAKILKSFLTTSTLLVRRSRGQVISFDGDRVLGVFTGKFKNSNAAKCGLQINFTMSEIIYPKFEDTYKIEESYGIKLSHGVGIDTGTVLVVRAGVRGTNDLLSIGRAANLAAKLSDIRQHEYKTYITATVYNGLGKDAKYGGPQKVDMWKRVDYKYLGETIWIYGSSWLWEP